MGHIAQIRAIIPYGYTSKLLREECINSSSKDALCQVSLNWPNGSLKVNNVSLLCCYNYQYLGKGIALNKLDFHSPNNALSQVRLK